MNGRKKPLVWSWPPARNGAPAPSIQAEITADPEIQPPAQEAVPCPANGEEALQSPIEMAENTGASLQKTRKKWRNLRQALILPKAPQKPK